MIWKCFVISIFFILINVFYESKWKSIKRLCCKQILLKELSGQQGIIHKLEDTVESLVQRSGNRSWSPLADRQQEMVSMFIDVQASARERRDELLDRLNEVIY